MEAITIWSKGATRLEAIATVVLMTFASANLRAHKQPLGPVRRLGPVCSNTLLDVGFSFLLAQRDACEKGLDLKSGSYVLVLQLG